MTLLGIVLLVLVGIAKTIEGKPATDTFILVSLFIIAELLAKIHDTLQGDE